MKLAETVMNELREGNRRFVARLADSITKKDRAIDTLVEEHAPRAIIVGCSDARVPVETIFDQSLGKLFVVRVAGNVVTDTQMGSVEFAAAKFGAPLAVVLGHSNCGAVAATLNALTEPATEFSPGLQAVVDAVTPAVESLVSSAVTVDELMPRAVRANIAASVDRLKYGSDVLSDLIAQGKFQVVGAEYSLQTGQVRFYDDI